MFKQLLNKFSKQWIEKIFITILLSMMMFMGHVYAAETDKEIFIDRVQLATQQIELLKNRLNQSKQELSELQQQHDKEISQFTIDKINKSLIDKSSLDIAVYKSNLDSINIELTDSQQLIVWLEKNIQEIKNQLNVLGVFGLKFVGNQAENIQELKFDLAYQQKLLNLEKTRTKCLQELQALAINILQFKKDNYTNLNNLLKSRKMLHIKQQQVQDELAYQEKQNDWLNLLNKYFAELKKTNPEQSHERYTAIERNIFYANENANLSYFQSLIARYKDQIQQMKLSVMRGNSISLLNEIGDHVEVLSKQINKLDHVLKSRIFTLQKHISYLTPKKDRDVQIHDYLRKLESLIVSYQSADKALLGLNKNISDFHTTLDHALQVELSARQGFPTFSMKTILDLGKEMLLVPTLTFQVMKSLSNNLIAAFKSTSWIGWGLFVFVETIFIFVLFFLHTFISHLLERPSAWRDKINSKWLSLQWLRRDFIDFMAILNVIGMMFYFGIPPQNFMFIIYLSFVWLIFKGIMRVARLCLVEATHDSVGQDMKLYHRLKWLVLPGGVITALTVFVHQLPLIYELKTLCDRLFLLLLMVVSIFLLRSWRIIPQFVLSHMESQHPYLQKSIRLIGILIPLLMFSNSVIGLFGFVNLIMTISKYEGLFLIVLIGYLILRGLLSDGMEQLSRLLIQYANNGWLWTEAILKPIDNVLRITLFLVAWIVLFLLYGWDKQPTIMGRITSLFHYQLINVLNTTITPLSVIELFIVISIFYWTAKWTREFVYRMLLSRTKDMGIRNSIAILSQYSMVVLGAIICLRVLGIDLRALVAVAGLFAFGIGLGLRDLANNFACGFLILLERPLRVGDIVSINSIEGEVSHIGSRAVTVRTWDNMELLVPNAEIFNKSFTNWTSKDNIVRTVINIKISRYDNPHEVKHIIQNVLAAHKDVLNQPMPEVFLKDMSETLMNFEIRYFVNIRQVVSRTSVISSVLMNIWDAFAAHGIKAPYPQHEIFLKSEAPEFTGNLNLIENLQSNN